MTLLQRQGWAGALCLGIMVLTGGLAGWRVAQIGKTASVARLSNREIIGLHEVAMMMEPEIVSVVAMSSKVESLGTAFPLMKQGIYVTNYHVVRGANQVDVVTPEGITLMAKVVAENPRLDIALLQVVGLWARPIPLATKGPCIGSPEVSLAATMATGGSGFAISTVTALNQSPQLDARDYQAPVYHWVFSFAADILQGNSGGPILNSKGELWGIVTITNLDGKVAYAIPVGAVRAQLMAWERGLATT